MHNPETDLEAIPSIPLFSALMILAGGTAGALLTLMFLPRMLPGFTNSVLGADPKAYWYLARSSAFAAYLLLWLATALGIAITNRLARLWPGGPGAFEIHQFASLLGLGFAIFHGLILLGDSYINYTLVELLVPFQSQAYRPIEVGLGQITIYLLAIVSFSFYVRRFIGRRGWRLLHYLSFGVFFLALIHGITSGTDSSQAWALQLYLITGGTIVFLTIYRVLTLRKNRPQRKARPA